MMLILIHCKETDDENRRALVNEFFQHEQVIKQNLKDFFH